MKIGLIDVDCHASKKKWGATIYPNIALGKISRYHKNQGDMVEWAMPFEHYDVIYQSKIFNFTPDTELWVSADKVIKGGSGYDISSKLPKEIDLLQPDYSIYPNVPNDTAFGFLTRGCPNKCNWCIVPKKEGMVAPYMDVDEIAIQGRDKLVLMDNNILAAGDYAVEQLHKIINRGYRVDFNQAIDSRLVTDEFARLLASVKWIDRRIRFGCDTRKQIDDCEKAISLIQSYGYKGEFFLYTMLSHDIEESYNRIHYWWQRNQELRKAHQPNIYAYAQPYRDPLKPNTLPQWQKDMASWVNKKMCFQIVDFKEFTPRKGFYCSEYFNKSNL